MQKVWTIVAVAVAISFLGLGSLQAQDEKKKQKRNRPSAEQVIKKLDTDKNGTLSLEEFLKSPRIKDEERGKKIFAKWDGNSDGQVCAKELDAAFKKMREARKKGEKKGGEKKAEAKKGCDKKSEAKKGCDKKD